MSKRRVAITGAAGLIGGILRSGLAERYELRCLTHRSAPFESIPVDLADVAGLTKAIEGVDVVVHLAGAATVEASWESVLEANIAGTRNMLEACVNSHVPKVILASSNHVVGAYEAAEAPGIYQDRRQPLLDERSEIRADSLYGASKAWGEVLARYYHDFQGLSAICLRIGTVLPDDDPGTPAIGATAAWLDLTHDEKRQRLQATWLSHRDCTDLVAAAIDAEVGWAIVYGVSDDPRRFWSLRSARDLLGFVPTDSAP
jgi:nucleoside-diphosphate-sugar epimerase